MKIGPAAFVTASVFIAGAANAQQMHTMHMGRNFYLGVSGGAVVPSDVHITATGPFTASGDISFDTGGAVTVTWGYHFNDLLAGEVEGAYASYNYNNVSGQINGAPGTLDVVDGNVESWLGMVNAIVTPLGRGRFSPYLGGGIGLAAVSEHVGSYTLNGAPFATGGDHNETDFAGQIIAGLNYNITPAFSLGGRYHFVWVDSSSSLAAAGETVSSDNATAHVLSLTATYHF